MIAAVVAAVVAGAGSGGGAAAAHLSQLGRCVAADKCQSLCSPAN